MTSCVFRGIGCALFFAVTAAAHAGASRPDWRSWSPQAFEEAERNGRLVLLAVKAEWCAACRRMDAAGFRDPRVLDTLRRHYVAVRADIDREPEIMRRYGARGVPAVIVLDAAGNEIIQRRGYLEPDWLYWMLAAVADDPDPGAHR
jgi:thiol:disulfide interchange protein